jgi:hypothetical protein
MSNLRTKFVGYLSEGEDIEAICSSLNLDDDEKRELAKIGERGVWLVKKVGLRPFLIKSEDFPIAKDMPDEELLQRMQGFLEELEMLRKQAAPVASQKMAEQPRVVAPQLSPDAWDLLVNVCGHPFLGIRSRCYKLKMSVRRIEAAIEELVDRQLVAALPISLGRFRPIKFLVPSDQALGLLSNIGHDTSLWRKIGHVGFEHSLYQVLIAYSLRKKGYEATIEKKLASGRRVDVYCCDGRKKTGIEIELTTANIDGKVEGIEELDELVILMRDEEGLRDALVFLKEHPAINKVTVQKASEFLRENSTRNSRGTSGTNPFGVEQT